MKIEQEKLSRFEREILKSGSHESVEDGMCVMEMVAYLAGEKHSDHPACASPVIASFLRSWNDALDDDARQFLKPYAIRVIGTSGKADVETRRAWLAADWLIRVYVPEWLECADLAEEADQIRALPEITGATIAATLPMLRVAEQKAIAAWDVAWSAAESAGMSAAWIAGAAWSAAGIAAAHAAWSAAWTAAESAAVHAAKDAAEHAARSAARSAAWSAVMSAAEHAARSAAWSAARSALSPTVERLQQSAFELLDRMIAVTG